MESVVTKSAFIEKLSSECDILPERTIEEATKLIIDLMTQILCHDGRIEVRGFGSFTLHHRAPRLARNPKTGDKVKVTARATPHFKPGKALREAVADKD